MTVVATDCSLFHEPKRRGVWAFVTPGQMGKWGYTDSRITSHMELIAVNEALKALTGDLLVITDHTTIVGRLSGGWNPNPNRQKQREYAALWDEFDRLVKGRVVEVVLARNDREKKLHRKAHKLANERGSKAPIYHKPKPLPLLDERATNFGCWT